MVMATSERNLLGSRFAVVDAGQVAALFDARLTQAGRHSQAV
jgi:hypothetical protein